jgi:hypothetical protein
VTARQLAGVLGAAEDVDLADVPVLRPGSELDSVPPDRRSTPVSLPSARLDQADGAHDQILSASEPPRPIRANENSSAGTALGWKPAPPPPTATTSRRQTPKGFQAARPESAMYAGGTILNWAGRVADIQRIEEISSRETTQLGGWDTTLQELQSDPEVEEAIEAIDSDPPPAPFVRSEPPAARSSGEAGDSDREPDLEATVDYHEPPEVDPPPLTYAQVFEPEQAAEPIQVPRAAPPSSMVSPPAPRSTRLRWALLVLVVACGLGALAYWRSMGERAVAPPVAVGERGAVIAPAPEPGATETQTATATTTEAGSAPAPETGADTEMAPATAAEPTPALGAEPAPEPAPEPESGIEAGSATQPPIYAETGAPDTYEAQLALARRLKRGSRAVAAYRRAIQLDPSSSPALAELARLMLARQNTREATELAERATALDPSNALGWVTLGAARQMRGDRQGARQAYQSCAKLGRGRYVQECRAMLR